MPTALRSKPAIRFFRAGWRAFLPVLKDAPTILLDEASASLDVENETVIREALSRLIRNKTVIVIAHRMLSGSTSRRPAGLILNDALQTKLSFRFGLRKEPLT